MTDLARFVSARLDEEEAIARSAQEREGTPWTARQQPNHRINGYGESHTSPGRAVVWNSTGQMVMQTSSAHDAFVGHHIALHDPERVLREVEAKRALLKSYDTHSDTYCGCEGTCPWGELDLVLEAFAAVYSDHPNYQRFWR